MIAPLPRPEPDECKPGQVSVWDFPRPPRVEPEPRTVRIYVGGVAIVVSKRCLRVLETSHPPTIYVPNAAFRHTELRRLRDTTTCEWKGTATAFTIIAGGKIAHRAAWSYLNPPGAFRLLDDHTAVFPGRVDVAYLDTERVTAQPGGFYGGWITADLAGPFKGEPGSEAW